MTKHDGEQFPLIMPTLRLPGYLLWMMGQIIKSNIEVTKLIWQGDKAISPTIVTVKATQKSEVARVLYANSITMTPGTITLAVKDKDIEVHALTKEGAASLKTGDMDKRVTALEGGK